MTELIVIVATVGILTATAVLLYLTLQQRVRLAKAQADGRDLVAAVSVYAAHMGSLPTELAQLTTQASNRHNGVAGPFIATLPTPPSGWSPYTYTVNAATLEFSISASGDGATIRLP